MTIPQDWKVLRQALRRELLATRAELSLEYRVEASRRIFARLNAILVARTARVVGAYLPIGQEPDALPWIEAFVAGGGIIALPVVVDRGQPLAFCPWRPGEPVQEAGLGTRHPAAHAIDGVTVTPDVLVIPLVGFDAAGFRLGYGGGYYDRTLADAAHAGTVVIGVGFELSRVTTIYPQPHDRRMHRILTEVADRAWDEQGICTEQMLSQNPAGSVG
jgi:5-formyltetrahydrofolate cyclo-ligase